MAENTRDSLINWVKQRIHGPTGTPATREFRLYSLNSQGVPSIVTTVPVPPGEIDESTIAQEILDQAIYTSEALAKTTNFEVSAFREREREPFGRRVFRIVQEQVLAEGESSLTEPANAEGVLAMTMRHQEQTHKLAVGGQAQTQAVLLRTIDRLEKENERLRAREDDNVKLQQQLLDQSTQREIAKQREVERAAQKAQIMKMLMGFAPGLAKILIEQVTKKLAGGGDSGPMPPQLPPGPSFAPPHPPPPPYQPPPPPPMQQGAPDAAAFASPPPVAVAPPIQISRELLVHSMLEGLEKNVLPNDAQQVAVVDTFIELLDGKPDIALKIIGVLQEDAEEIMPLLASLFSARELRKKYGAPLCTSLVAPSVVAAPPPPPAPPPAAVAAAPAPEASLAAVEAAAPAPSPRAVRRARDEDAPSERTLRKTKKPVKKPTKAKNGRSAHP